MSNALPEFVDTAIQSALDARQYLDWANINGTPGQMRSAMEQATKARTELIAAILLYGQQSASPSRR